METPINRFERYKSLKHLCQILFLILLACLFLGYALIFGVWWFICPKEFPPHLARFWTNNVIPPIVIAFCLVGLWGAATSNGRILKLIMPLLPTSAIAAIIISKLLYPVSMRPFLIIPACVWTAFLLMITWITFKLYRDSRTPISLLLLCFFSSAAMGLFLPWSQQSWLPATKPLNPADFPQLHSALNSTDSAFSLSGQITVLPRKAGLLMNDFDKQLQIYPLLTFYSQSPDRCWILFSPRSDRIGKNRIFKGMRRIENGLYMEYSDECQSILKVTTSESDTIVNIEAACELEKPVYSHLNTFTEFTIKGKEKIFVSFSPCQNERIEVTSFDYPFGRPARLAYLDKTGIFRVVQAKSAEKGPFTTLAEGNIEETQPLHLTIYDGDAPIYRISLNDWSSQCSRQLSPTAGWGLPENAIEFSLDQEDKAEARFFITLASTSGGRGFDSVGHNPGIYQNRITVENLTAN